MYCMQHTQSTEMLNTIVHNRKIYNFPEIFHLISH